MVQCEKISGSTNYHCKYLADEDILILGSSFAKRNFCPKIISKYTDKSCYNAGEAGNGIICSWARYNMFIKRHTPEIIVLPITPSFDYLKKDDYIKYLDAIKGYYGLDEAVDELYYTFGNPADPIKLQSNFVRYNTSWISLLSHAIKKDQISNLGYEPLFEIYKPKVNNEKANEETDNKIEIDTLKYELFEKLIASIAERNIVCIAVITPVYGSSDFIQLFKPGIDICEKYNVQVLNHLYVEGISDCVDYFYDSCHLNDQGAKEYSVLISNIINQYICKQHLN